jgi:AraC-like DNA-binding protein/mannose-6-phosphate isomerase-like protein (cupin superfamily)
MAESDFSLYLTHSAEDEAWQMVCTDAGRTLIAPGSPYPPRVEDHPAGFGSVSVGRRINEYQLVYILDGRGQLQMEGQTYPLESGSVFLLFPDVQHSYHPDTATGWTEYWVGFAGAQVDALLAYGIIAPTRPVLHAGYQASLLGGFQSVFHQVKAQAPLYQFRVCAEILRLLAETLSLERMAVQQTHTQQVVEQAKAFIGLQLQRAFDLEELANEVRLSLAQLNDLFKAYTGMTPYQYCIHAKINRAKEILVGGETSVKEIAWQVGFDDPYYFSRLFKKKTGVSPSHWTGSS